MRSVFDEIYIKSFHYETIKGKQVMVIEEEVPKRIDIVPFKRRNKAMEQRGVQKWPDQR